MSKKKSRVFSRELKLSVVKRILAGEETIAVARELKVARTTVYKWRESYRKRGPAAFPGHGGRPAKREASASDLRSKPVSDLDAAKRRISMLEHKIGQQQLELDFFRQALRQVRGTPQLAGGPGAKPSTPASKR